MKAEIENNVILKVSTKKNCNSSIMEESPLAPSPTLKYVY